MTRTLNALVTSMACAAIACADTPHAVRGLASSIEVEYGPRLKARSDQSPTSPVMVRVSESSVPGRQRIEYIGTVAGSFDLREFVEREDGRALDALASVPVVVVSQLPADHGTDLFGTADHGFNWRANYRELMLGAGLVWLAIPVCALILRALRTRQVAASGPGTSTITLEDQLHAALDAASIRILSVEERAQLELLVFRFLMGRGAKPSGGFQSVAQAFCEVREHPQTRDLVAAIERWLHTSEGGDVARADALAALEAFRRSELSASSAAGQSAIGAHATGAGA